MSEYELHEVFYNGEKDVEGQAGYLMYCFHHNFYYDCSENCYYIPLTFCCCDPCGDLCQKFVPEDSGNSGLRVSIDYTIDELNPLHCLFRIDGEEAREKNVIEKKIDVSVDYDGGDQKSIIMVLRVNIDLSNAENNMCDLDDSEDEWFTSLYGISCTVNPGHSKLLGV